MAAQQLVFADTIAAMKRAMDRPDDAAASDDSICAATNRGNKRKRKARYVQQGRLDQAGGSRSYRRKVDFNGYPRYIISCNPQRIDQDGDIVDEDEDESFQPSTAENDPYCDIQVEEILMPLTNAGNLDKHPALSVPYNGKILKELINNAREVVEREQAALHRMKQVLVRLGGDDPWAPCGDFMTDQDVLLLNPMNMDAYEPSVILQEPADFMDIEPSVATQTEQEASIQGEDKTDIGDALGIINSEAHDAYSNLEGEPNGAPGHTNGDMVRGHIPGPDDTMSAAGIPRRKSDNESNKNGDLKNPTEARGTDTSAEQDTPLEAANETAMDRPPMSQTIKLEADAENTNPGNATDAQDHDPAAIAHPQAIENTRTDDMTDTRPPTRDDTLATPDDAAPLHRMTTRARAAASPGPPSISAASTPGDLCTHDGEPSIHPFFWLAPTSLPCSSAGLPHFEATDIRRLLLVYVQKQGEVVRGASTLLSNLRRADRLRRTVWRWCRSEAHLGEMSDGEDWVDAEEWGIGTEGLKKGEEVEEEEVVSGGKKTRQRRAAA